MARSNEYTHGGSAGKNIVLLLRALLNIVSYAALFFGLCMMETLGTTAIVITVAGAILSVICLWVNLVTPFVNRKK